MRSPASLVITLVAIFSLLLGSKLQIAITTFKLPGRPPRRIYRVAWPYHVPAYSITNAGSVTTKVYDRYGFRFRWISSASSP